MAFASPMPGISSISSTVHRLKPESESYRFSNCRATSTAFAPGNPVRKRIAINSGSVSAAAPRASNFSRGRSSCGSSLIFKLGAPRSGTQLVEHFAERVAQLEERVRERVRGETVQLCLRVAHRFDTGVERGTETAVRRVALKQFPDRARFLRENQFAVA